MKRALERLLVVALCAAVGWFYVWTVRSNNDEWNFDPEQDDYYNLLIDGWLDGQLHMKVPVPDALLQLKDPYDPTLRPPDLGLHDASFYRGKYYLYFGAAPVVLLMLPYRLITGVDLPQAVAIFIFAYGGFLVSVATWRSVRRRYFPETGVFVMSAGVLVLGFASLGPVLMRRPHMWELPIAAGYALALLTLALLWRSLHADDGRRRMLWFAAAALALGLAIASRPTYLLATPLLAVPLVGWWRAERKLPWQLAVAAVVPLACVGSLMAWHNYARFGNPLQFGQAYQFSLDYESKMAHFRFGHVPFNVWRYFFSAPNWLPYFPFIEPATLPPKPPGFGGHDDVYGILRNLPIAWLALAAPLALLRRESEARARLGAWLGAAGVLFAIIAGVLLFFFGSLARYQLDFTPVLMLIACVGLLAIERELRATRLGLVRLPVRSAWGCAAVMSVVFAMLFSMQLGGRLRERNPAKEREVARRLNAIPYAIEQLRGVRQGPVEMTLRLAGAGRGEHTLLRVGDPTRGDRILVQFDEDERARFGFARDGAPTIYSRVVRIDGARPRVLRVGLGSLFPPAAHPYFGDMNAKDVAELTRQVQVTLDDETLIDERRSFPTGRNEVRVESPTLHAAELRRVGAEKPELAWSDEFLRVRLTFPSRPATPREPVIAVGSAIEGALLFVHYVDDTGQIAWGGSVRGERAFATEPMSVDLERPHELTARWWRTNVPGRRRIELRLDGTIVGVHEMPWPEGKATHVIGRNVSGERGCAPDFTGTVHQVQRSADGHDPLRTGPGNAVRMRVQFPVKSTPGARDPLIVTGRTAAGDMLMVEYVDGQTVRFGLDHWGGGGGASEPVRVDRARVHEIEIAMDTLVVAEAARPVRSVRNGSVRLWVDGTLVWTRPATPYPTEPDEIAFGRNPVGGTSCGPEFTGRLLFVERVTRD